MRGTFSDKLNQHKNNQCIYKCKNKTLESIGLAPAVFTVITLLFLTACGGSGGGGSSSAPAGQRGEVIIDPRDYDGDGLEDAIDLDYDGDFLIEIYTARDLDEIRNYLSRSDNVNASLRDCGSLTSFINCQGYELMADISLAEYENWIPLGYCDSNDLCPLYFDGIFEGNGHSISDLRINLIAEEFNQQHLIGPDPILSGVGLFGAATSRSFFRNLSIKNADVRSDIGNVGTLVGNMDPELAYAGVRHQVANISITDAYVQGDGFVGGLFGYYNNGTIDNIVLDDITVVSGENRLGGLVGKIDYSSLDNIALTNINILGRSIIGGLAGQATYTKINNIVSLATEISGTNELGGLVGEVGFYSAISNASILDASMIGDNRLGGAVGQIDGNSLLSDISVANSSMIGSSNLGGIGGNAFRVSAFDLHSTSNYISGKEGLGGVWGRSANAIIKDTSASNNFLQARQQYVGGLVGYHSNTELFDSYSWNNSINGDKNVGGLIGYASQSNIERSYVYSNLVNASDKLGGLLGYSLGTIIKDTYVQSTKLHLHDAMRSAAYIGGIIGFIYDTTRDSRIESSYVMLDDLEYSTTNDTNIYYGGLIGFISAGDNPEVTDSYWGLETLINGSGGNFIQNALFQDASLTRQQFRYAADYIAGFQSWTDSRCPDDGEGTDVPVWNFGTFDDHPVFNCRTGSSGYHRAHPR